MLFAGARADWNKKVPLPEPATVFCRPVCFTGKTQPQLTALLASLPPCPARHARTHLTAACVHPAHQCQSAPPPRLRRRPRPVTLRRPPLQALTLSSCVCLERLLPAAQGAQLSVHFPACSRHSQCIWSAWRSIAHKLMVRRTCYAQCVATPADARSAYMEGGSACFAGCVGRETPATCAEAGCGYSVEKEDCVLPPSWSCFL